LASSHGCLGSYLCEYRLECLKVTLSFGNKCRKTRMLSSQWFESHDETDFWRSALSLIKNVKEDHTRHTDTPTLEPDQVFCVIELYRNKREKGKR
jgi:hypothetical protein